MKTVFSNSEIMHVFNLQEQKEGRTANKNIFFYGTKIYSYGYHYLLAEVIDKDTVMINNSGYSNTTSKHISLITSATRDKKQFFYTQSDIKRVNHDLKNYIDKLTRARKTQNYYLQQINSIYKSYIEYLTYTKSLTAAKKNKLHRETVKLMDAFYNNYENLKEKIQEQNKKQAETEKKRIQVNLKKWRNLEIDWFSNKTNYDYLRLNGANIETSQGVKISIIEAKRLLNLIESKSILGAKIDDKYTVTSFNGLLKAGCHNIPISEIKTIKLTLNNL